MGSWVTDPRSPCRSAPSPPSVETGRRHSECPLRVMCLPSASHLGCVANIRGAGHVTRQSGSHCVRTSVPPLLLAGDVLGVGVKRSCPRLAVSPDVSLHCRKDVLSVRPRPWTQEPHRSAPCQCVPGNRVLVNGVRRNAWMGSTGMSPSHLVPVKTRVLLGNSRLKIQPKWLSSKHMKTCLKQCLVPDKKHHYFVKTLGGGGGRGGKKSILLFLKSAGRGNCKPEGVCDFTCIWQQLPPTLPGLRRHPDLPRPAPLTQPRPRGCRHTLACPSGCTHQHCVNLCLGEGEKGRTERQSPH